MSLRLVSNETGISRCGGIVRQRFPLLQQRHGERFAIQAGDNNGVGQVVTGVTVAHDEHITLRCSEKVGNDAAYGDGLDRSKELLTIELLNDIVGIPVTGDDDLSAVQLHSRCQRPFLT